MTQVTVDAQHNQPPTPPCRPGHTANGRPVTPRGHTANGRPATPPGHTANGRPATAMCR